jgi:hypothetical protein
MTLIYPILAFTALAAPPQIRVEPNQTVIRQNAVTVTIQADGSILVRGPNIDLVLPGSNSPLPPNPGPAPDDELANALKSIYGGEQDALKRVKANALVKSYEAAFRSLDQASTVADFAQAMTRAQTLKFDDLRPLRDRIATEINSVVGSDPEAPLDIAAAKGVLQRIISILKGV